MSSKMFFWLTRLELVIAYFGGAIAGAILSASVAYIIYMLIAEHKWVVTW